MISVSYRKKAIKITSIWFIEDIYNIDDKSSIVNIHGYKGYVNDSYIVNEQKTYLTNLNEDIDEIFKKISKNCRYDIKKASKEELDIEFHDSLSLSTNRNLITSFNKEYNTFSKQKKIKNTYNKKAVKQYIRNGNLVLTKAMYNGQDFAQHIYVVDGNCARLLYSVSNFRIKELDKDLVGRANKLLHYEDILYFKENNYSEFDWGGVSSFDNPNGVDKFKKSFGGIPHTYNNVMIINSPLIKFILKTILKR